jgi:NAD-dependent SIR2 family protein deacetylase
VQARLGRRESRSISSGLPTSRKKTGGWTVDFQSYSPGAALEWHGYATVRALSVLRRTATMR